MKRIIILVALLFISPCLNVYAEETTQSCLTNDIQIQKRISDIGYRILNANKIDVRMIFVYQDKEKFVKVEPGLMKRQIIIYDKTMQFASSDDEIAAYLAREICKSAESYAGVFKGFVSSAQIKMAPKKYELFFDKRAVDFMVLAGYNPLGFITFIHKSQPQKRYDKVSRHNLTSKRLAHIYEYIYTKYPYFLNNNEYLDNETYQHFLLSSIENRKKLNEKIKSGLKKAVDYE
ncbi:TPA: hypothetical protein IAA87_08890 [Candidatus Avigastranaerophilus faecigallinarum]|nr:hypothetical protein [Candidatus Avigastranaerophilus faecigallinarum]